MVAPAGAGPWPQITSTLFPPLRASCTSTGTSPPGPLRCGSTTCSVKAVATAASKALPPFSKVAMPIAVAIQWVEATTPNVPSISGRVVNGLGLIFFIVLNFAGDCRVIVVASFIQGAPATGAEPTHEAMPDERRIADGLTCSGLCVDLGR